MKYFLTFMFFVFSISLGLILSDLKKESDAKHRFEALCTKSDGMTVKFKTTLICINNKSINFYQDF